MPSVGLRLGGRTEKAKIEAVYFRPAIQPFPSGWLGLGIWFGLALALVPIANQETQGINMAWQGDDPSRMECMILTP